MQAKQLEHSLRKCKTHQGLVGCFKLIKLRLFVGNKVNEENKKVNNDDGYFEDLLEKYKRYLAKDDEKIPLFLTRGWRYSLPSPSQPSIDSMKSDLLPGSKTKEEREVRLPSSTMKIMDDIGGGITTRRNNKNSKIIDKISSGSRRPISKNKISNLDSPDKSLPNISSRNHNTNSKLSQRFQTLSKNDKSKSMNSLIQNGVNVVTPIPSKKLKVS